MNKTTIEKRTFGKLPDGTEAALYVLENKNGAKAKVTTYGAILTEFLIPNKEGKLANVVLGFDSLEAYLKCKAFFGATVGRTANRIAAGKFQLEGKNYQVETNDDRGNSLHGGFKGFDKRIWEANTEVNDNSSTVIFKRHSEHLEEGFPGTLTVEVSYRLADDNTLTIGYRATSDQTTIINLTNHSYFNLDGAGAGDILDHELKIAANSYTPVDDNLIPTGAFTDVSGTPFDFRKAKTIGKHIKEMPEHLGGFDHNFVLMSKEEAGGVQIHASSPRSGRQLKVNTTQPGLQLYCGNFLDGIDVGNGGAYFRYHGFCLETQHFPDSINQPSFPSVVLKKGETYSHQTVFDFSP
jgi:aldose 1-epimerase